MKTDLSHKNTVEVRGNKEVELGDNRWIATLEDDSIWFHIFSFFGNEHGLTRRAKLRSFCPTDLFKSLSLVSKEHHVRLIRYMQVVPQNVNYREKKILLLPWFCSHGVKLGSVDFYGQIRSETEFSYFLWLLKCCNTDQLTSLKVNFHWTMPREEFNVANELEAFAKCPDGIHGPNDERHLLRFLNQHVFTISKLDILVSSDQLSLPFFFLRNLNGTKSTLEELSLNIRKGSNKGIESIYQRIANATALRKLSLNVFSQQAIPVSHCIQSKTLEEIDIRESAADFIIHECHCPSLKIFRGKCIPRKHWPDGWVGLRAATPITKMEIRNKIHNGDYVAFNDEYFGFHTLEYVVAERPFKGLSGSDSCVVLMDVLNYN